jgi:hypothetical protein
VLFVSISALGFSQQNRTFRIIGTIPPESSTELYQLQLGAFKIPKNADDLVITLRRAGFSPVKEEYREYTRVLLTGIRAREMPAYIEMFKLMNFCEVIIRDKGSETIASPPPLDLEEYGIVRMNSNEDEADYPLPHSAHSILTSLKYTIKSWGCPRV